jgi:hypothetical protein
MKFKNLSFIDHPATDGVIAQVIDDSGKKISVVAGKGLYSDSKHGHRESVSHPNDAISFEVLVEGEDDVRPYQSREDIDKILSQYFYETEDRMTPRELAYNLHEDMEMISANLSRELYPDIVGYSSLKEDEQIEVLETLFKQKTITWKFNFI